MLQIDQEWNEKTLTYKLEGRLDTITSPDLEAALKKSMDETTDLILDMEKLDYISSSGLRVLLSAHKTMSRNGSMKLIHVGSTLMDIFEVTGFSDILTIE